MGKPKILTVLTGRKRGRKPKPLGRSGAGGPMKHVPLCY